MKKLIGKILLLSSTMPILLLYCVVMATTLSCQELNSTSEESSLIFSFAEPVDVISTKAASAIDTNSFILSIQNTTGQVIYHGLYGERPKSITVPSGTYDISVKSGEFDSPEFDSPQYGDDKVVVVSNGQKASVSFLCKMTNACIKLTYSERFKKQYGSKGVVFKQNDATLAYSCEETRYAYLNPGNVEFQLIQNGETKSLFNRVLKAGECHNLELDASNNESDSEFSITVDTAVTAVNEIIVVGEDNGGANGKSALTAMSIEEALNFVGDTLWVCGYIVGTSITTTAFNNVPPFATDAHLALSSSKSASERSEICPVELSKKAFKSELGLQTNPDHLGKKIAVKGVVVDSYFGSKGIKSVSDYSLQK